MEVLESEIQLSPIALAFINIAFIGGIIILVTWLTRTRLGSKSLTASNIRRNNMPFYFPFIPLVIWFFVIWVMMSLSKTFLPDLEDWQSALLDNLSLCIGAIVTMGVIVFMVRKTFARKLKGFGLDIRTTGKDLFWALLNLLGAWPAVAFAMVVTLFLGTSIFGPEFKIQQHVELEFLMSHPQISLRLLIFFAAVVIAPVFEEMLFRGMFQSMLRSHLASPWAAIAISSAVFAAIHGNISHWPALFVLGGCLGYSYEKSGSLLRPIFIHCFFNAVSIIAVILSS